MKSNLKKIGSLLAVGLLAIGARAGIVLQDNFNTYADGPLTNVSAGKWVVVSKSAAGTTLDVASQKVIIGQTKNEDDNSVLSISNNAAFSTTNILYVSYTINYQILPTGNNGDYFTHFSGAGGFKGRIFGLTNGAAVGTYRVGIANGSTAPTILPTDLSLATDYTVVARLLMNNGTNNAVSTIWISPANELASSVTATDVVASGGVNLYGFRQPGSTGTTTTFLLDDLLVGTTFADVVPGSVNKPSVLVQPRDGVVFTGQTFVFTNLAAGDAGINYAWYYNTNSLLVESSSVVGVRSNVLVLTNLQVSQSGTYSCVSSNTAGTNITRYAVLTVSAVPLPPVITNQPTGGSYILGDTVSLSVAATGLPAPAFQWKFVTNSVTNIIVGATSANYSFTATATNQTGNYFVTVTNAVGYLTTNSATVTVTITPPPTISIAAFRAKVDNAYAPTNTTAVFTLQGIVTTWTNMTTSTTSSEFYMQDGTGGIAVFLSGGAPSNMPPFGASVKVTGPMASFNGLLEISPVATNALHSVTVNSLGNTVVPQPLPFDPFVTTDLAKMKSMESCYFVASNVFLKGEATFASGSNEGLTNNSVNPVKTAFTNSVLNIPYTNLNGQVVTFFVTGSTDLPGKSKPSGPVTIYGVLGYFTAVGYEFTASRLADVITYQRVTNVLSNARQGDLMTNTYLENVVRPNETITTFVSIGDAAGGIVTLTPSGILPTGGYWTNITSGSTATATFVYTGSAGDAGTGFTNVLGVTSTAGTAYSQLFNVYVPSVQEQQIAITEFLVSPTTNPASSFYNPLARSTPVNGISTNDQYIEIVNLSDTDLASQFTIDTGNITKPVYNSFAGFGTTLFSSNSLVVYGGKGSPPQVPGLATPLDVSAPGLFLPKTGSGVLVLRNFGGNIIDRVAYSAGSLSTNGSMSRFPAYTSPFVPQNYISTNAVTAGLQYEGGAWNLATTLPGGVTGVGISYINGQAVLTFTAATTKASTLWNAADVSGPYSVIFGRQFPTSSGSFTNVNSASKQFYFITAQ